MAMTSAAGSLCHMLCAMGTIASSLNVDREDS